MSIKNKFWIGFLLIFITFAIPMFVGVNDVVVPDSKEVIQNEVINAEAYGQIYLHFDGINAADEKKSPKILINGNYICSVTEKEKVIDVFDGCVVELDSRGLVEPVFVSIYGKSENVIDDCVGKIIMGNGYIDNIGTFTLKK